MSPKTPSDVADESSHSLLLTRTQELERLNEKLEGLLDDERRTSDELRQANTVKDEFLGLLAHELRTPLTTILGNASILSNRLAELETESVEQALADILNDARRLERLIRNLLVLAKPGPDSQAESESVDLRSLAAEVIEEHRRGFPETQLILIAQGGKLLAEAHADTVQEILHNLLSNAEKYSPAQEAIEIQVQRHGRQLEVSVMDRGPGIAQEEVDSIFEPFFRSQTTSSKASGLGLGLAVCKRLIEEQGGTIRVTPREGGGSIFVITLPVSGQRPSPAKDLPDASG